MSSRWAHSSRSSSPVHRPGGSMTSSAGSAACASVEGIRRKASGRDSLDRVTNVPAVGAVVTTYKRGLEYLPAVLESIEAQSFTDHETTVAVDGADQATVDYLEREWPRVRVVST